MAKWIKQGAAALAAASLLLLSPAAAEEPPRRLVPVGAAIGVHLETDGLLVIGMSELETESGSRSPAFEAGIRSGDLILEVAKYFGMSPFTPMPGLGEDYSFCWRVKQIGKKMWCDSSVKLGHVGQHIFTEEDYLQQREGK